MKKKLAALLAAVLVITLALTDCTQAGRRTAAMKFLNQDIVAFADTARAILASGEVPETRPDGSPLFFDGVERIYTVPETGWVAFVTGTRDQPGDQVEVGFYFSPDDQPLGYQGQAMDLTRDPVKTDVYTAAPAAQAGRQVTYLTEHMQIGWFYYEHTDRQE